MFQSPGGAGGFMRGGMDTTPGGGYGGGAGSEQKRCCLPVTLRQVADAEEEGDSAFLIDKKNVNMITFVAKIRGVTEASTNIKYKMEDGTGSVEVTLWLDSNDTDDMARKRELLLEGAYVRVIGNMRTFMQKRSVIAFHVGPIQDFNEITNHMLASLHAHLKSTVQPVGSFNPNVAPATGNFAGGYSGGNAPYGQQQNQGYGYQQQHQPQQQQNVGGMAGYGGNAGYQSGGGGGGDDFKRPAQRDVLGVIKSVGSSNEIGVSFGDIVGRLKRYSEREIRDSLDFLAGEGHIYSTVDDDHYKSTEDD